MMRHAGVRSIARNSVYLLIGQAFSVVSRAACVLILVRFLSPADYGALNYGVSWYLTLIVFTFVGQDVLIGRNAVHDRKNAPAVLGATLSIKAITVIAAMTCLLFVGILSGLRSESGKILLLLLFALAARSIWYWCVAVFTGFEENSLYVKVEVMCRSLEVLLLYFLLEIYRFGVLVAAFTHSLSWVIEAIIGCLIVFRRHSVRLGNFHFTSALKIVSRGIPNALFAGATMWVFLLPVILFRNSGGGGDELGQFALAVQLLSYLYVIPSAIFSAAMPVLSRSGMRGDGKDKLFVLGLTGVIVIVGTIFTTFATSYSAMLAYHLFGQTYLPAARIFAQAAWILIPLALAGLYHSVIVSNSTQLTIASGAPLLGMAVMALLFPFAMQMLGTSGAVAAMAAGILLWLAATLISLTRGGFHRLQQGSSPSSIGQASATNGVGLL